MSNLPTKYLQDVLFIFIGFFLLVQGTRVFLDRKRRNEATEVIQAILMFCLGGFIVSMWYSQIRHGNNNNGGSDYGGERIPFELGGGEEGY